MSAPGEVSSRERIRSATSADAAAIAAVHAAAARAAYGGIFPPSAPKPTSETVLRTWEQLVSDPAVSVMVAVDEEVIGGVALRPDAGIPAGWLLDKLYVRPDHWGRGVGSRLHDTALARAAALSLPELNLWVLYDNHRARRMYRRRGWRLVPGMTLANDPPSVLDVLYARKVGRTFVD